MKIFFSLSLILMVPFSALAYQWPAPGGDIATSFGQRGLFNIEKQITLQGSNGLIVQSPDNGEVIFEQTENQVTMPSKKGKVLVLAHNEDMRSIYSNLEAFLYQTPLLNLGDTLAQPSQINLTQRRFNLAFYDNKKRQFVNPLLFTPVAGFTRLARIERIYARGTDNTLRPLGQNSVIQAGKTQILVSASEFSPLGGFNLAPYSISLEWAGETLQEYRFDAISANKGEAYLVGNNRTLLKNLYSTEGYFNMVSLNLIPGESYLTIKITNINGLETILSLRLRIVE